MAKYDGPKRQEDVPVRQPDGTMGSGKRTVGSDRDGVSPEDVERAKGTSDGLRAEAGGGEPSVPPITEGYRERLYEAFDDGAFYDLHPVRVLGHITSPEARVAFPDLSPPGSRDPIVHALAIHGDYDDTDDLLTDAEAWNQTGAPTPEVVSAIQAFAPERPVDEAPLIGDWFYDEAAIMENGLVVTPDFVGEGATGPVAVRNGDGGWDVYWTSYGEMPLDDYFDDETVNGKMVSFHDIAREQGIEGAEEMNEYLKQLGEPGKDYFVVEVYSHGANHYSVAGTGNYPDRQWDVGAWGVYVPPKDEGDGTAWRPDVEQVNEMLDEYSDVANGYVYDLHTMRVNAEGSVEFHDTVGGYTRRGIESELPKDVTDRW